MAAHVWIVDDDENIRTAMQMMCGMLGYAVSTFASASEIGKQLLQGKIPDILFLDINMPDVNGMDLLKYLRQKDRWDDIIVIIVSSESQEHQVEEAIRNGADGYVFKPINFDELSTVIQIGTKRRKTKKKD